MLEALDECKCKFLIGAMGYFAAILLSYRWLAPHGHRWSRFAYVIGVPAFIAAATYVDDELRVEHGVYFFDSGYKVWHDLVYGLAIFSSPFLVHEILRRKAATLA